MTEDQIYREALQLAQTLRATVTEALENGTVSELPPIDPADLGGDSTVRDVFAEPLAFLTHARGRHCALWTDDLCTRLFVDARGPLLQKPPVLDMVARVRHTFSQVPILGTADILHWLESTGQITQDRHMTLLWQLHQAGYRFLEVGGLLLWLFRRFRYNQKAVPVAGLLRDLETAHDLTPPHVDPKRFGLFVDFSVGAVLSRALRGLWLSQDPGLTVPTKKALSSELCGLFERVTAVMTNEPALQRIFWKSLISQMWLFQEGDTREDWSNRFERTREFIEWVNEYTEEDSDRRRAIIREIEDLLLEALAKLRGTTGEMEEAIRNLIIRLLEPVSSRGLFKECDPLFRRLVGLTIGVAHNIREIYEVGSPAGEPFEVAITQDEVERQACDVLAQIFAGQRPERLRYLLPYQIGILLEHTVDPNVAPPSGDKPLRLHIPADVPLLFLPLAADASLRKRLFDYFRASFEQSEPALVRTISDLFSDLVADDREVVGKSLQEFYRSYLLSTHFQLTRDLRRGYDYLARLPLGELDALCGALPPWPKGATFREVIENVFRELQVASGESERGQIPTAWPLLIGPSQLAFSFARSSDQLLQRDGKDQDGDVPADWIERVEGDLDIFASFAWLGVLLDAAYRFPAAKVIVGEESRRPLREWVTDHLLRVLRSTTPEIQVPTATPRRQDRRAQDTLLSTSLREPLQPDEGARREFLKRAIHAKVLRMAFRAVASPVHIQESTGGQAQEQEREVAGELLFRGVALAHRILATLLQYPDLPFEELDRLLTEVTSAASSPWTRVYALRDQLNPELYGPGPGQYDHVLAGTLAVFCTAAAGELQDRTGAGTSPGLPFWLTRPVRRALLELSKRPENIAERQVRKAREQGVPDRLATFLNRTPREYAAELLRFASPQDTREEDILLKGQIKLIEILQEANAAVRAELESAPAVSDHPSAVVKLHVGGEERRVLVEAQAAAEPRRIRRSIERVRQSLEPLSASYGVIVAPAISERSRQLCEEQGIGYLDLQGNTFFKYDRIFIKTASSQKEREHLGRAKSVFTPVSTRVVRLLLADPERRWKLQDLADAAHMSLGQVHKVKQALLDQEFIDAERRKGLFLKDPAGLLNAWRETYRYNQNEVFALFSLDKIPAIEEKVRAYCERNHVGYALTLFSGAAKLAPFVRYSVVTLYYTGDREALQRELQLKPVDSGANVLVLSPYDEGVFYGLQKIDGWAIVHPVQLYLDLYSYGGRGREQAEFLREQQLSF